jgi:hypothetical protein
MGAHRAFAAFFVRAPKHVEGHISVSLKPGAIQVAARGRARESSRPHFCLRSPGEA